MKPYALNKMKYLNTDELTQLNRMLSSFPSRDTLMIDIALHTGARATELLNIRRSDLNDEFRSVFIQGIKNSNDREIPLPEELYLRLREHVAHSTYHDRIFPITYRRLAQIWHTYSPVTKKFHSLRHTFAIELYKRTRDIKLVQVALGHRNINNTMIYTEYVYQTEELRKLIVKVG